MSDEFFFMKEKIKDKPFYKKKWVQVLGATVILAVVFGSVSGYMFVKVSEFMKEKTEKEAMTSIEIPRDSESETDLEEDKPVTGESSPGTESIVISPEVTLEDYTIIYAKLRGLAREVKRSLVTVTAVNNGVDWFNEAYENKGQSCGMIIGDNGLELLILTKYSMVQVCDGIKITFVDDTMAGGTLKKYDVTTDFAVISVNLSDISEATKARIVKADLGNSKRLDAGMPVLAVGMADGNQDSLCTGILTSVHNKQSVVDGEYSILMTDMHRNAASDGVLINLDGEVVGILQQRYQSANMQAVLSAYGISDVKSLLEHLSNNQDIVYLGIKGISVTAEQQKKDVPEGVYVTEVEMDSPAMKGGIHAGDIIQAINGQKVAAMSELSDVLLRLSNKQNITLEGQRLTKDGYKKMNYQTSLSVLE